MLQKSINKESFRYNFIISYIYNILYISLYINIYPTIQDEQAATSQVLRSVIKIQFFFTNFPKQLCSTRPFSASKRPGDQKNKRITRWQGNMSIYGGPSFCGSYLMNTFFLLFKKNDLVTCLFKFQIIQYTHPKTNILAGGRAPKKKTHLPTVFQVWFVSFREGKPK